MDCFIWSKASKKSRNLNGYGTFGVFRALLSYDSAIMEYLFKNLKKVELDRRTFQTVEELDQSLVSYFSGLYNPVRTQLPQSRQFAHSIFVLIHFLAVSIPLDSQ